MHVLPEVGKDHEEYYQRGWILHSNSFQEESHAFLSLLLLNFQALPPLPGRQTRTRDAQTIDTKQNCNGRPTYRDEIVFEYGQLFMRIS